MPFRKAAPTYPPPPQRVKKPAPSPESPPKKPLHSRGTVGIEWLDALGSGIRLRLRRLVG